MSQPVLPEQKTTDHWRKQHRSYMCKHVYYMCKHVHPVVLVAQAFWLLRARCCCCCLLHMFVFVVVVAVVVGVHVGVLVLQLGRPAHPMCA